MSYTPSESSHPYFSDMGIVTMPALTCAELAYREYCRQVPGDHLLYKELSFAERWGWGQAVAVAVHEACSLEEDGGLPLRMEGLQAGITTLRTQVQDALAVSGISHHRLSQAIGIDRHTLSRWLAGEDNISVRTLLAIEAWKGHQQTSPSP